MYDIFTPNYLSLVCNWAKTRCNYNYIMSQDIENYQFVSRVELTFYTETKQFNVTIEVVNLDDQSDYNIFVKDGKNSWEVTNINSVVVMEQTTNKLSKYIYKNTGYNDFPKFSNTYETAYHRYMAALFKYINRSRRIQIETSTGETIDEFFTNIDAKSYTNEDFMTIFIKEKDNEVRLKNVACIVEKKVKAYTCIYNIIFTPYWVNEDESEDLLAGSYGQDYKRIKYIIKLLAEHVEKYFGSKNAELFYRILAL